MERVFGETLAAPLPLKEDMTPASADAAYYLEVVPQAGAAVRVATPDMEDILVSTTIIDYADHSETIHAYTIPISDTPELQVEVRVDGMDYEVLRWRAAPIGEREIDDGPELWDMELF